MIERFQEIVKANQLSPLMKSVVFTFGRVMESRVERGRLYQTVEWRRVRYTRVVPLNLQARP
jgi:hypothetical protein